MKFEKIDENKIRVTLTVEDLALRGIEIKKLKPNSPAYQDLLCDVLDHAEIEMGLGGFGKRMIVECSHDSEGNCTITITKTDKFEPGMPPVQPRPRRSPENNTAGNNAAGRPNKKNDDDMDDLLDALFSIPGGEFAQMYREIPESRFDHHHVLCFEDFESLLGACTHCKNPRIMPSQLFLYKNKYFLVISVNDRNYSHSVIFEEACSEYHGTQYEGVEMMPVLLERGKPLIKRGAISTLLRKFEV